jgi:hypothetical protein
MRIKSGHTHARDGVGKTIGVTAAALLASASVMMMPTTASAFNIQGLIATAVAHYGGGGHYAPRAHVASRHGRRSLHDDDDANSPAAADTKPPEKDQVDAPLHRQYSNRTGTEPALAFSPSR